MDKKVEPLVSVILPVYKVEQYVETCIQSILNQTYQKLEIIIVNDGTPDQSMKIAEKVAKDDKRTIFINKENGGLSSARNAGLEVAQGEFVFFVDSDDKIHSKTIEILISEMKDDVDISVIAFKKVISLKENEDVIERAEFKYISGLDALKLYLDDNTAYWIVSWGKLYRKSLFENIRFPLGKIHEDEYTTYQLIYEARKVAYSNLEIYYYLQRSDSIKGSIDLSKRMHYMEALVLRNEFLKKKKLSEMYK
ncbi:MAG: glycosyltransferase, partial [Anaerostipes sp.]|nr:glycosyltransferase [Anaerostipes sp.]